MESKLSLGVEQLGADFSQKNGNHSEHMCDLHLNLDDLGCFCLKLCSFHIYCFHKDPGCKQSTNRRMGFTSAGLWQDNGLTPILDIFNNYCINTNSVNVWHGAIQTPKEDPGMCRTCLCEDVCMDDMQCL